MRRKGTFWLICATNIYFIALPPTGKELESLREDLAGCSVRLDGGRPELRPRFCCPPPLQQAAPNDIGCRQRQALHRSPKVLLQELAPVQ